jgi:hypothetical protein
MRIGGIEAKGPHEELLVLPRGENDLIIRARAVLDMDEFDKICPEPTAPGRRTKDGFVPNHKDPTYQENLAGYHAQRLAFLVLRSLEPSQIEWETVKMEDPRTWANYLVDLRNGGLSSVEINRVIVCVMQANALDEKKLEEARKAFLLGQAQEVNQ